MALGIIPPRAPALRIGHVVICVAGLSEEGGAERGAEDDEGGTGGRPRPALEGGNMGHLKMNQHLSLGSFKSIISWHKPKFMASKSNQSKGANQVDGGYFLVT